MIRWGVIKIFLNPIKTKSTYQQTTLIDIMNNIDRGLKPYNSVKPTMQNHALRSFIKVQEDTVNSLLQFSEPFRMYRSDIIKPLNTIISNLNQRQSTGLNQIIKDQQILNDSLTKSMTPILNQLKTLEVIQSSVISQIRYTMPSIAHVLTSYNDLMRMYQRFEDLNFNKEIDETEESKDENYNDTPINIDFSEVDFQELAIALESIEISDSNEILTDEIKSRDSFIDRIESSLKLDSGTLKKLLKDYATGKVVDIVMKVIFELVKLLIYTVVPVLFMAVSNIPEYNYTYNRNIAEHQFETSNTTHYVKEKISFLEENLILIENMNLGLLTKDNYIYKFKKKNSWPVGRAKKGDLLQIIERDRIWTKVGYQMDKNDDIVIGYVFTRYVKLLKSSE